MTHINLFCEVFFSSWLTSSFASSLSFISFSVIKDGFNIKTFCDLCTIIKTVFKHHRIIPVLFRDKSCSLYILPSNSSCIYPNKPIWHYWYQNYIIIQSFFPMYCDVNCQTRLVKPTFTCLFAALPLSVIRWCTAISAVTSKLQAKLNPGLIESLLLCFYFWVTLAGGVQYHILHCNNWELALSSPINKPEEPPPWAEETFFLFSPQTCDQSNCDFVLHSAVSNLIFSRHLGMSRCCGYVSLLLPW